MADKSQLSQDDRDDLFAIGSLMNIAVGAHFTLLSWPALLVATPFLVGGTIMFILWVKPCGDIDG